MQKTNYLPDGLVKIDLIRNVQLSDYSFYDLNDDQQTKLKFDTLNLDGKVNALKSGDYMLNFTTEYKGVRSNEIGQELNVLDKSAVGFYIGYLLFPLNKIGSLDSWLNIHAGLIFNFTPIIAVSATPGISVFNSSAKKFYGEISLILKEPNTPLQGGYSWLIYYNPYNSRTESAIGINLSYSVKTFFANINIGPTVYYSPNSYKPGSSHNYWVLTTVLHYTAIKRNKGCKTLLYQESHE